jgi:nucleoside-diphosphate-sugar epimerase
VLGFGPGTYPLPCVLAEDVASALLLAKDAPNIEGLAFNLAGDVQPTAAEYVEEIRLRTRRNFRFVPRSVWSIGFGEYLRWLIKAVARKPGNVSAPYRDVQSVSMSSNLDCSLAKRVLGWAPVSDRAEFFHQAIDVHLQSIPAGDIRLPAAEWRAEIAAVGSLN